MNKKLYCLILCYFLLGEVNDAEAAQTPPIENREGQKENALLQEIDKAVNHALDVFHIPGMAIGIVVDGNVVLSKGYGYRNLAQKLPVTEHTLFGIASCTKAFTAFLLGQLVDEGKINWDDPVIAHLPDFRLMDEYATSHTTIRDLLAHRSGLARHDLLWYNSAFTQSDVIPALPYLEPACPFREKFMYNNLMYTVAGLIIEKVTRQPWQEVLSSRLFQPLAMLTSNSSKEEMQQSADFSLPYAELAGKITALPFVNSLAVAPAGDINSSASDMLKWVQLQLSEGTYLGKPLIDKNTLKEMHTIQMAMAKPSFNEQIYYFGYGMGWFTGTYRGHYYLHHGGGDPGFISQVSLLPQQKIGVVILSNSSSDTVVVVRAIAHIILDALLDKTDIDWMEHAKNRREAHTKEDKEQAEKE